MEGVVNVVPAPSDEPPVEAAYKLIVPAEAVASRETVPVLQRLAGVVAVMDGIALTVAITAVRDAVVQSFAVASA